MSAVIETRSLSKWYGNVLGLSDVTISIESGITGLLGPNGAGKSTFMKLITGQLKPNIGGVSVDGQAPGRNYQLFSRVGFCPEQDSFYEEMTGWQFLTGLLRLHHLSDTEVQEKAVKALEIVEPPARARLWDVLGLLGLDDRPGIGLDANGLPLFDWVPIPGGKIRP